MDTVFFEQDLEPYGLVRDEAVTELAERRGIRMVSYASQMLYDVRDFFYEEKFDDNDEKENEAAILCKSIVLVAIAIMHYKSLSQRKIA